MLSLINEYALFERQMINSFQTNSVKNMREGNLKKSFVYLLIDPLISENFVAQSQVHHCYDYILDIINQL